MGNRLHIAFLTSQDPRDRRSQSGVFYFMAQALQKHCGDVSVLGPVSPQLPWLQEKVLTLIDTFATRVLKKRYNFQHSLFVAKAYARLFAARLAEKDIDVIVAPNASTEIAFLKTTVPIVYLSDTTMKLIHDYYSEYSNLVNGFEGNIIERRAIRKAELLVYRSAWAARSAVEDYGADAARVHVLPNGANLELAPERETILRKRKSGVCRLLFVGVDWYRKGGELAFETLLKLNAAGLRTELIVCGCTPPARFTDEHLTVIPFLNKNDDRQRRALDALFLGADFLLLPSRSECFGMVFCEASAYGLPAITTATGGISGAVTDGENGYMLPLSAPAEDYASLIQTIYQDDDRYYNLVRSSRRTFEERLNWDVWGVAMNKLLGGMARLRQQAVATAYAAAEDQDSVSPATRLVTEKSVSPGADP